MQMEGRFGHTSKRCAQQLKSRGDVATPDQQHASETSAGDIPPGVARGGDTSALLVDSAISRCETLRRVLELEEWISGARDNPILATACRRWQEERAQWLTELHLERGVSPISRR